MNDCLGYDCDGNEIYEYRILRAVWSNDIPIEELNGADPRFYCAIVGEDGKAYAISVYDWYNKDLIRKRENIIEEEIPVIVKPIEEMKNYEVAMSDGGNEKFYYSFDRDELKEQLNNYLKKNNKQLKLIKKI